MYENADREWDAVADELVDLQSQLDNMVQALAANQAECDRLAQHASNDIKDDVVPLLFDDATTKEMVKLKREITAKNMLNKSMQTKLGTALQEVEKTKKALATTEDERDMISEQMDSAMLEVNATNEALIRVKANSASSSSCQTNSSNQIFNVKMTGLPTYDGTRTLDAITSFLSTLHRHF
jgi:chromosome segregation ATPase